MIPTLLATALLAVVTPANASASNPYEAAYKAARWGPQVTVSFPSPCSMTFQTTGEPTYHADYYLAPAFGRRNAVAYTPVSNMPMAVIAYPRNDAGADLTIDICPTKAPSPTAANMGPIGYTIDGEAIFNPYEASGTVALSDNAAYTFSSNGGAERAAFIDSCNSHAARMHGRALWHHHGVPTCLTKALDGNGPSHLLGFALDGFPIYGGRDLNGRRISVSQLDACNGITSPTPEFPHGAYHYVLPFGVTGRRSSLNCYTGTPSYSGP